MSFDFQVLQQDGRTRARRGVVRTAHSQIETPVFMPVGTAASVKGLPQSFLEEMDASILLANTYHLYLRPGAETVQSLEGLHGFMAWQRSILTDSGGFQVFSQRDLTRISEEGVTFRSHLDGSSHFITPEKSIQIQQAQGADIIMAFDDCTPYPVSLSDARASMERSMRWADRCRQTHQDGQQTLFGIVQGSVYPELRRESLQRIEEIGFAGVALGGFSVGEPKELMFEIIDTVSPQLPAIKPRYVMGVGTPLDLVRAVALGIDMFDCVMPTRNARNGTLFTSNGLVRIKNARYRGDSRPLDEHCQCRACRRYSRAYLRHLYTAGELLASVLLSCHNVHFYLDLMRKIRESIALEKLPELEAEVRDAFER